MPVEDQDFPPIPPPPPVSTSLCCFYTGALGLICFRFLQLKRYLYYNFIDSKKAFDRVWYAGQWPVLGSFYIEELVQAIQELYENSSNAVLLNSQLGKFFNTTYSRCPSGMLTLTHPVQPVTSEDHAVNIQ